MTRYRFTNSATSTLASAATAGATAITVASAAPFPSSGNFTLVIDSEIMLVTGVVGNIFTVARAQEGTSAAAHSAGATVQHVVTAEFLNGISEGAAGATFPSSPADGDRFFRTDRGIEYFWSESVGRWLSVARMELQGPLAEGYTTAGAGELHRGGLPIEDGQDIYLVAMTNTAMVMTTNGGSDYWKVNLWKHHVTNFAESVISFTTSAYSPGTYNRWTNNIGLLVPASTYLQVYSTVTFVGSPGPLYLYGSKITYRLVG